MSQPIRINEADPQDDQPKNADYKAHIYNIIICTLIEDIKDKSSSDFVNWISILQAKEELEQKKNISYIWKKTTTGKEGINCQE